MSKRLEVPSESVHSEEDSEEGSEEGSEEDSEEGSEEGSDCLLYTSPSPRD